MVDVEMQFANGNDDTEFENLMMEIAGPKAVKCDRTRRDQPSEPQLFPVVSGEQNSYVSTQRIPAFVRNVTPIIEALLEQLIVKTNMSERSTNDGVFASSLTWKQIGCSAQSSLWQLVSNWKCKYWQPIV